MRRPDAELLITSLTRAAMLVGILIALPFILARMLAAVSGGGK